jgi:tetratricopeptide (TPR) repeat protein
MGNSRFSFFLFHILFLCLLFSAAPDAQAQYNTNRLIISGQIAYDNQDYVVAIQHFNNVISGKPYLYEPWYYRGLAKLQLDDYVGAENDFNEAIKLNPYIHQMFSARAISRINLKKYTEAIDDYDRALKLNPDERGYWFNRAYADSSSKTISRLIRTSTIS